MWKLMLHGEVSCMMWKQILLYLEADAILKALTDHLVGGSRIESRLIRSVLVNWRLEKFFLSHFKGPSSQDQQKTFGRRLMTFKVTLSGQSHCMLLFILRKVTLPNRINSVPWMNTVTPTPYYECTQLAQQILWLNWMKVTWRSRQTAYIHGTELVWRRSFMVRSLCDCVKSWYGVDVPRKVMLRSWFFACVCAQKIRKFTLRSQKNPHKAASKGFLLILWLRPFKMRKKKFAEPPVCHFGTNESSLASQFEWSVNTFKCFHAKLSITMWKQMSLGHLWPGKSQKYFSGHYSTLIFSCDVNTFLWWQVPIFIHPEIFSYYWPSRKILLASAEKICRISKLLRCKIFLCL